MIFLHSFALPFAAFVTAGLLVTIVWAMLSSGVHEKKEEQRHQVIAGGQERIVKAVEKVGYKLDTEIIPALSPNFSRKGADLYEVSAEGVEAALKSFGVESSFVSDDGEFLLVCIEFPSPSESEEGFKVYYHVTLNLEAKDLLIECYAFELKEVSLSQASALLKLNDKYKVSGLAIEDIQGRRVLKCQYLLDAPGNYFSSNTLNFAVSALSEVTKEAALQLALLGDEPFFIPPQELMRISMEAHTPSGSINFSS